MATNLRLVFCLYAVLLSITCKNYTNTPTTELEYIYNNRTDLKCNSSCISNISYAHCCVCKSYQSLNDVGSLQTLYNDSANTTFLTNRGQLHNFYTVRHQFGNLTELPENICEFPTLVFIDLSLNKISKIGLISCVVYLDSLILKGNKIEYLSNHTFLGMKFIRIIDLSYNQLNYMEPGFLINMAGTLFIFDVSHNFMNSIDVTNALWGKQQAFCRSIFSYNNIERFTNELNWECKQETGFGLGGMVDISNNNITQFPHLGKLGFQNIRYLGKLMPYGFDLRNNTFMCDCKWYPFLSLAAPLAKLIYRDYFNVHCHSPPNLENKLVLDFLRNDELSVLICNISLAEKCPPNCICFYQPGIHNRTIINCSNSRRTKLPAVLPDYSNLDINLSYNQIAHLESKKLGGRTFDFPFDYFKRVQFFNLSNNIIQELPDTMFHLLGNITIIDLNLNRISSVPRTLQYLKPCQILLGAIVLDCGCQDIWIKQWLPSSGKICLNNTEIICRNDDRLRSILELTEEDLECHQPTDNIWISWFFLIVFIFGFIILAIVYKFKFEIFILTRNFRKRFSRRRSWHTIIYDVYVSCDEDNESIRTWVSFVLAPHLEEQNLNVFLPFRDCKLGNVHGDEIIDIMSKSRNYIIILSEEYHGSVLWNQKEWKYAWYFYKSDLSREIIVVNYDMLLWNEVAKQYLGAFLKLHKFIDFSNYGKSIERDVASMLQLNGRNIYGKLIYENESLAEQIPLLEFK